MICGVAYSMIWWMPLYIEVATVSSGRIHIPMRLRSVCPGCVQKCVPIFCVSPATDEDLKGTSALQGGVECVALNCNACFIRLLIWCKRTHIRVIRGDFSRFWTCQQTPRRLLLGMLPKREETWEWCPRLGVNCSECNECQGIVHCWTREVIVL